ncbi:5-formyltetrahydrofolate cyclo-ligase [Patiriisocius sp. Uisw_017]|jgi:5-formyltetrahydrofolate cyclo-ligase|uniref:5-formyltetrahydrofolate cyclo-ligase n=1 Tax=Patiriisocius sp. Uisw_017 TaxID=3230968 RepID=UPI0039E940EC
MDKKSARKKHKELRTNLTEQQIEDASLKIANNCLQLPIWEHTNYHIFLPIEKHHEVDTNYLLHILHGKDKTIIVSKSDFKTMEMKHYLLQENTALKVSKFGIPEPVSGIKIHPKVIDVVFVPLLAFDTKGNRIGYGKGFYDRFLSQCNKNALFVGLSFFEADAIFETEETDIPLHHVATPKKGYSFS